MKTPRDRQVESAVRDMPLREGGWERRQREGFLAGAVSMTVTRPVRVRVIVEVDTENLGVVPLLEAVVEGVAPGGHAAWIYPDDGLTVTPEGSS